MNKKSLMLLTFLMLVFGVHAQQQDFKPLNYIGLKAGFNYNTADFGHRLQRLNIVEGYRPGFNVGLMYLNYMEKNIGLQVELNYTRKGWRQLFDANTPDFTTDLDYLELPFMLNAYIGNKKTRVFFNFGWYFEYLLSVSPGDLPADTGSFDFFPYDSSRDLRFGYGLIGGGGLYREFNFGILILQGSFAYGISNIIDPITEDSGIPDLSFLITSSVSLGYLIRIGN